jgi:hypothetical protein
MVPQVEPPRAAPNEWSSAAKSLQGAYPPHFHATYGEYDVTVGILDGVVSGTFPKRALRHVLEWLELHQQELLNDWQLASQRQPLKQIAPLE